MGLKPRKTKRHVVICTERRGVFMGRTNATEPGPIVLEDARMCVYWTYAEKGVLGLAAQGPGVGCRVGPKVTRVVDTAHTIIECTPEAVKAWELEPWG